MEGSRVSFFLEHHPELLAYTHPEKSRPSVLREILDPSCCRFLADRRWGVSLAAIEIDSPTAAFIKDINRDYPEIPFTMWVVLPDAEGYWTNETNIPQTRTRVQQLESWISYHDLHVAGFGLDIEPPIQLVKSFSQGLMPFVREYIKRMEKRKDLKRQGKNPSEEFAILVQELKEKKIHTESYEFLRYYDRLASSIDVSNVDTRYSLIYTYSLPNYLARLLVTYGMKPDSQPAFGDFSSTGYASGRFMSAHHRVARLASGAQVLKRDIATIGLKESKDHTNLLGDFKVFALTGIDVARWTENALQQVRRNTNTSEVI